MDNTDMRGYLAQLDETLRAILTAITDLNSTLVAIKDELNNS